MKLLFLSQTNHILPKAGPTSPKMQGWEILEQSRGFIEQEQKGLQNSQPTSPAICKDFEEERI